MGTFVIGKLQELFVPTCIAEFRRSLLLLRRQDIFQMMRRRELCAGTGFWLLAGAIATYTPLIVIALHGRGSGCRRCWKQHCVPRRRDKVFDREDAITKSRRAMQRSRRL